LTGDRPLCKCHGLPMTCPSGWRCSIRHSKTVCRYQSLHPEKQRRYYESNREKVLKYKRHYREVNPDKAREWSRRYYEANREKENERSRVYKDANPGKVLEQRIRYRNSHRLQENLQGQARYWRKRKNVLAAQMAAYVQSVKEEMNEEAA